MANWPFCGADFVTADLNKLFYGFNYPIKVFVIHQIAVFQAAMS